MADPTLRRRLTKADADLIRRTLEARGFQVHKSKNYIEARDAETHRCICTFYWQPANPTSPAGWRFDMALADCFSLKDLKTATAEARRVQKQVPLCREAWQAFSSSRSDRRWTEYRSQVASLFMRQDPEDEEIPE